VPLADTMTNRTNIAWSPDGTLEVLTFDIGGEIFAVEAVLVQEILDPLPETRVPGADPLVHAVINFRGRVIPLADLRVAFGMDTALTGEDARIIVLQIEIAGDPTLIGIITEKVNEVTTFLASAAEPPPLLGLRWPRDLLRAVVRRGDDIILLPDLATLFAQVTAPSGEPATLV